MIQTNTSVLKTEHHDIVFQNWNTLVATSKLSDTNTTDVTEYIYILFFPLTYSVFIFGS